MVLWQIKSELQCFDGLLNSYFDRCLDIISILDTFNHIPREENSWDSFLAQQASGYLISKRKSNFIAKTDATCGRKRVHTLFSSLVHHGAGSGPHSDTLKRKFSAWCSSSWGSSALVVHGNHDSVHRSQNSRISK
jgi:predicted NUDIX family phosphoesterase